MPNDLQDCYRLLELELGANEEEVKRSYRELVKIWHPDRFAHDKRLEKRAQEKLKLINLAYERICQSWATGMNGATAASGKSSQSQKSDPTTSSAGFERPKNTQQRDQPTRPSKSTPSPTNNGLWFVSFIMAAVALFLWKGFISTRSQPENLNTGFSREYSQPYQTAQAAKPPVFQVPTKIWEGVTLIDPNSFGGRANEKSSQTLNSVAPEAQQISKQKVAPRDYFTVGSTKTDVLAVQGTPDRFTNESFYYGASHVVFEGDRVTSWDNSYPKLKAVLLPVKKTENKGYFTVGSTKDEVLVVQGTPDRFTEESFYYGASHVVFEGDRVTSWDNSYPKLKAALLPVKKTENKGYFTVGSTKDEVLAVQGTPDRFTATSFYYGASHVVFEGDRVTSWDSSYPKLKAVLLPVKKIENKGYFTVGSTKDEVLAVQGTPDRFTDTSFYYGASHVIFEGDRVTSWDSSYPKLKVRLGTD